MKKLSNKLMSSTFQPLFSATFQPLISVKFSVLLTMYYLHLYYWIIMIYFFSLLLSLQTGQCVRCDLQPRLLHGPRGQHRVHGQLRGLHRGPQGKHVLPKTVLNLSTPVLPSWNGAGRIRWVTISIYPRKWLPNEVGPTSRKLNLVPMANINWKHAV